MSLRHFWFLWIPLTFLTLSGQTPLFAGTPIKLYTYYLEAPYVTGENQGLTFDLADYLNKRSKGRYQFIAEVYPRKRLDRLMERGVPMVVPWASPDWFVFDEHMTPTWSEPFLNGASLVVTNASDVVEYSGPSALEGLTLAGVGGYHYPGIDELVAAKRLDRRDYLSYEAVFKLLSVRRGHCTVVSDITANYLIKKMGIQDRTRIAQNYHSTFSRHFMILRQPRDLEVFLNRISQTMMDDPEWQQVLSYYGIQQPVSP